MDLVIGEPKFTRSIATSVSVAFILHSRFTFPFTFPTKPVSRDFLRPTLVGAG